MGRRVLLLVLCTAALFAASANAQAEKEIEARRRVFAEVGPGFRAIKRGSAGRYYVLTAPGAAVVVYDAAGPRVGLVPPVAAAPGRSIPTVNPEAPITFGNDLDVDATGRVYVADRGANAVKVFSPEGTLELVIPIAAPTSVAVLPEGEIAVASMKSARLVTVFAGPGRNASSQATAGPQGTSTRPLRSAPGDAEAPGKIVREFGDPTEIAERSDLNRFLNIGRLVSDPEGHLYYAFNYLPEPTVRKYDRYGYAAFEISLATLEFQSVAQAARREITRQDKRSGGALALHPIITAVGVDPATQEVWVALGNLLLHFDHSGGRRGAYRLYTPAGARLEAQVILVESDHLLVGSDPLGLYEFPRPDKSSP